MSPLVLVTSDHTPPPDWKPRSRVRRGHAWYGVSVEYLEAISSCGGTPLIIPPGEHNAKALMETVDALLLPGGDFDVHPKFYEKKITGRIDRTLENKTTLDIQLIHAARELGKPILGICGGMQVLAVAMGGSLIGDLPGPAAGRYGHEQPTDPTTAWHDVTTQGIATTIFGHHIRTNSTHHQAVDDPGTMQVVARASDGVVEAIAAPTGFALGVQWHPEMMGDYRPYQALIDATAT